MSFEVVSDELRTHAKHLDGLADRLNTAVQAARTVMMDDQAYGLLCAFLPPIIDSAMQQQAADMLDSAVEGMNATGENIRTAASSYDEQEDTNAQPFLASMRAGSVVPE